MRDSLLGRGILVEIDMLNMPFLRSAMIIAETIQNLLARASCERAIDERDNEPLLHL